MKFSMLLHRVNRAEELLEGRREQVKEHTGDLVRHWKLGWTPWRIVLVGLGIGFLTGQTRPSHALGISKWLRLLTMGSSIFNSLQAAMASWQAEQASDKADDAADSAQSAQAAAEATAQTTPATSSPNTGGAEASADQAARHAATTRAAGMATVDDGGHQTGPRVSSYGRPLAERGETERWVVQPPRPAEAATDVSER